MAARIATKRHAGSAPIPQDCFLPRPAHFRIVLNGYRKHGL
jgi:hypothetical protein